MVSFTGDPFGVRAAPGEFSIDFPNISDPRFARPALTAKFDKGAGLFYNRRRMEVIYQDEHFFAIDKPAGYFVHPPERSGFRVPREKICLYHLRKRFNQEVFPVHRLDAPTTGVLLFAFQREGARAMGLQFMDRAPKKTYSAVVRGHLNSGFIDLPLENEEGVAQESRTDFEVLCQVELPYAVGKKYPTARYSLLKVLPRTGRWHQIRRHFNRIAHPLLGDIDHGDSHHNRFFRDELKIVGLCLKATAIEFVHPFSQELIAIEARPCDKWNRIHELFDLPGVSSSLTRE